MKINMSNNKKNEHKSRRRYYLAAFLFFTVLALFFGGDLRQAVSIGLEAAGIEADWLREEASTGSRRHNAAGDGQAQLEVHFLDIGQGDATLITCDGCAMLVDAGNNNKGTQVQSYLESQNITKLDYVIGTHPDADHIGGLDVIITKFPPQKLFLPDYEKDTKTYEEVIRAAAYRRVKVTHPKAGKVYELGDAQFTMVGPVKKYSAANDNSICFLLEHGENRFLFTGDAEEEAEQDMLDSGADLGADVYKVPHHGSRTATTASFFQTVRPLYAVISCGDDNSYGHPHAEVLNRLRAAGTQMFRTDDQGTIVAVSDGTDIVFQCAPSDNWTAGE